MRWRVDGEAVGGFKTWLIKASKHLTGICNLELRVKVNLAIRRICEFVQSFARVAVGAMCNNHQRVCLRQTFKLQPRTIEVRAINSRAIERGADKVRCDEVEECAGARPRFKSDRCGADEGGTRLHGRQVELNLIVMDRQQLGTLSAFGAGEVGSSHN